MFPFKTPTGSFQRYAAKISYISNFGLSLGWMQFNNFHHSKLVVNYDLSSFEGAHGYVKQFKSNCVMQPWDAKLPQVKRNTRRYFFGIERKLFQTLETTQFLRDERWKLRTKKVGQNLLWWLFFCWRFASNALLQHIPNFLIQPLLRLLPCPRCSKVCEHHIGDI